MEAAFQLRFMAFAVDVIDRHGPSNEMRRQLKPKKAKGISSLYSSKQRFTHPSLITRRSASVLKVGVSYCTCGNWQNASPIIVKEGIAK